MAYNFTDEDVAIAKRNLISARNALVFNAVAEKKRIESARKNSEFLQVKRGRGSELQHIGTIPKVDFLKIRQKYGAAAFNDLDFLDWMRRRVLKPNGLSQ